MAAVDAAHAWTAKEPITASGRQFVV